MDATILNTLQDPAGVPFYPVVFQGLYILTWALHAAFVLLALGAMGLSIYGTTKQKSDASWKQLTPHLIQVGKVSVSLLILLGIAPLLFTQVIYDPNWYTANTLSGMWVFIFVYTLIAGYMMYYWYYYANKAKIGGGTLLGTISFLTLVFAGILMHNFAVESIQPTKWMEWYAPNGVVDTSGWNFHIEPMRLAFLVSLAVPVVGIFLQNYSQFVSTRADFKKEYIDFTSSLGTQIAIIGLLISAVLFVLWMLQIGYLLHPLSLAIIIGVVLLLVFAKANKNSYITTSWLVVVALLISGMRELIRFDIMSNMGFHIYSRQVNLEIPSTVMFLLTFVFLGFTGVAYILVMAWKVGKREGFFDASKDKAVTKLGNWTLGIMTAWMLVFFAWGMATYFKNIL